MSRPIPPSGQPDAYVPEGRLDGPPLGARLAAAPSGAGGAWPSRGTGLQIPPTRIVPPPSPLDGRGAEATVRAGRPAVTPGHVINNNYVVGDPLKSGGMGEVFRGSELHTSDPVAIKFILAHLDAGDQKIDAMFLREARTLKMVNDDSVVRYLNFLHDPQLGRYCLVMEYVPGHTLFDHLRMHGALDPEAVRRLAHRLAGGLAKAHAKEVIHRDLSPDNIMLPDGIVEAAKIIDFGIAKSTVVPEASVYGREAGKYRYMAPEQFGMFQGSVGPWTDIYALGLLTAAALLGAPLDMGSNSADALAARQAVPDLSLVPSSLRPALGHMLQPDPAARVRDMREVQTLLSEAPHGSAPRRPPTDLARSRLPAALSSTQPPRGLQVPSGTTGTGDRTARLPAEPAWMAASQRVVDEGEDTPPPRLRRAVTIVAVLSLAVGIGINAWIAFGDRLLGEPEEGQIVPPVIVAGGRPTDERILASYDAGPCALAVRSRSLSGAGPYKGLSVVDADFEGLVQAFEDAGRPMPAGLIEARVAEAQCPVLAFVRSLMSSQEGPVRLEVDEDSSDRVEGVVVVPFAADGLWLASIDAEGDLRVHTQAMSEGSGTRTFVFSWPPGAAPPFLLLAVATEEPLAAAGMLDGPAGPILAQASREVIGQRAATALAHLAGPQPE